MAQESAIIIWDRSTKVQHFIRRAAFDTDSPDFGFLVPTPTMPQLPFAEVEDDIFHTVGIWMLPKKVEQSRWDFSPMLCLLGAGSAPDAVGSAPGGVRVLHEQKVGGYEVNVVEADDAKELSQWIKKHGFSADPELHEWLKPYVAGGWKITAFKIMQDAKSGKLATTKAVRTSFPMDRPFFPYREPESKPTKKESKGVKNGPRRSDGRRLAILLVSNARMEGKLGDTVWTARTDWADQLTDGQRQRLARETGVPEGEIPSTAWMTSFEDRSAVRPSKDDVYFEPSGDQLPIRPPEDITYNTTWIPIDLVIIGLIVIGFVCFWIAKLRSSDAEAPG